MSISTAAAAELAARWGGGSSVLAASPTGTGRKGLGAQCNADAGVVTASKPHAAPADDAVLQATHTGAGSAATCAVSLAFLLDFHDACVAPLQDRTQLSTQQVVTDIIKPYTLDRRCRFAQVVPAAVAPPTAQLTVFVSHAFGNPFSLLVATLREHFANAVATEVFVWVDVFAINQHDPSADLLDGLVLSRTIELAAHTLVVLDRAALPMSRLWCLYEIGCTPPDKLLLLAA